jgi:hypothetical protein
LTDKFFLFKDEFDISVKTISESERKFIELKYCVLNLIIRDGIVFGFTSLASKIRKEYNYKFDNKLLHNVLSELEYEGKICILKIFKGEPFFYHENDKSPIGRENEYVYFYPTPENWFKIMIRFPKIKNKLQIKVQDNSKNNLKCPLCKKNVKPVRTPDGEYVCSNDGYIFPQELG